MPAITKGVKTSSQRTRVARGKAQRVIKQAEKRDRIIDLIRFWAESNGGDPPKVSDWRGVRGTGWPSYLTVIRYFGSWDEAILASGFQPRGRGRPVEEL